MKTTVTLPGRKIERASVEPGVEDFIKVAVIEASEVDSTVRGTDREESIEVDNAQSNDIVELEYEDNFKLWTSVSDLQSEVKRVKPEYVTTRSLRIPSILEPEAETRGLKEFKEFALKTVKLLRVDPQEMLADRIAGLGASGIAKYFESKLKPGPGLYRFTKLDKIEETQKIASEAELKIEDPYLLFIHGTGSSSIDGFGKIAEKDGGKDWEKLKTRYGDSILAFEHPTFSESPLQNALDLARNLPKKAKLHLVAHSRGGLIGDLLCLPPEVKKEFGNLVAPFQDREESRENDVRVLKELVDELAKKQFQIERFVRIACPSRGTVLASRRLDIYLSILLNALWLIPGLQTSLTYNFIKATLLALVKKRARPEELPGLEAMMPESPLINLLNDPRWKTDVEVAVIAGDIAGEGFLGKLKALAVYTFFLEANDLVVDTDSMSEGLRRPDGKAFLFSEEGEDVNHFSYIRNESSRQKLVSWLTDTGKAEEKGFAIIEREVIDKVEPAPSRSRTDLPTVFVLPGIMGSHLKDGAGRVWLSKKELIRGGLKRLEITDTGVGPDGLVDRGYRKLIEYLQSSYEVVAFDYDWRKSIEDSGNLLAAKIKEQLNRHKKPVRFLAHSMGGLVVRAMIANNKNLWDELCVRRDARLVMLGTPNFGSYAIPQLLVGRERILKMLALLDFKHRIGDLITIIRDYPGILDMLPEEFFASKRWNDLKGAKAPVTAALKQAKDFRVKMSDKAVYPERMFYVAGSAASTPCEVKVTNDGVIFIGTPLGDGRVTYELGILPDVQTFYTDTIHGEMANNDADFPAFAELLDNGKTSKLKIAPAVTRGEEVEHELREEEVVLFPTEEELAAAALGGEVKRRKAKPEYTLQLSVVHSDLRLAKYPVAVGHYHNDTIVSAEEYLDKRLNGELSKRYRMNLYPGQVGTAEVIHGDENSHPPGALVIGLGEVGEVTLEKVRLGVTTAALRYALEVAEKATRENATTWQSAAFSTLLVGTYGGNALTVENSVSAIIQGAIQANRALREQKLWENHVRIDKIEIVELFDDTAIQAVHAIQDIKRQTPLELEDNEVIEISPSYLITHRSGRFQRPYNQYRTGWWRRIQITGEMDDDGQDSRPRSYLSMPPGFQNDAWLLNAQREFIDRLVTEAVRSPEQRQQIAAMLEDYFNQDDLQSDTGGNLRFLNLTDIARAEDTLQATQRPLIDKMVAEKIDSPDYNENLAVALFELLVPNTIKGHTQIEADLVLVLDSDSAQYPWEMLANRTRNGIQPLSLQKGMVRQFKTAEFRHNPQYARSNNVLIIGDTASEYAELTGAQDEAEKVAKLLNTEAFATKKLIRPFPSEVMAEIFARDYKVLHLAAHGIYRPQDPKRSGMVLGNDMYLTAAELTNLRSLPELVFINCCHLGTIDGKLRTNSPGKLAASISEELIKVGVRAVIAAGWAVNDAAASTFAEEFYKVMLDGDSFGKAVFLARQKTRERHKFSNTWGAYQCYGDPDYILNQSGAGRKGKTRESLYYSRTEFLGQIRSIVSESESDQKNNERLKGRLERLRKAIPEEFLDGLTLFVFAEAWAELRVFDNAIRFYEEAILDQRAQAPLKAIERLANLRVRYGEDLLDRIEAETASDTKPSRGSNRLHREAKKLFDDAEKGLKLLLELGESHERYSLMGRVYKARARVSLDEKTLRTAADNYGKAYSWYSKAEVKADTYSGINWVTLRFLLGESKREDVKEEMLKEIEKCNTELGKRLKGTPDFWDRVGRADCALTRHLINGDLDDSIKKGKDDKRKDRTNKDTVIRLYRKAFESSPSPTERDSVIKQIRFIIEMLEIPGPGSGSRRRRTRPASPPTIRALREIYNELNRG